jgi:hypothetical protein
MDGPVDEGGVMTTAREIMRGAECVRVDGCDLVGMLSQADVAKILSDDRIGDLVEATSAAPADD